MRGTCSLDLPITSGSPGSSLLRPPCSPCLAVAHPEVPVLSKPFVRRSVYFGKTKSTVNVMYRLQGASMAASKDAMAAALKQEMARRAGA